MNRFLKVFLIVLFCRVRLQAASYESFASARALALSQSYAAVSDDTGALAFNAAGLAQLQDRQFSATYGRPFLNLPLKGKNSQDLSLQSGSVSVAFPLNRFGAAGFSWTNFSLLSVYQEDVYNLSYAYRFYWQATIDVGVSAKLLSRSFSLDYQTLLREQNSDGSLIKSSPFNKGQSCRAFSVDVGFLAHWQNQIKTGFSVKDLNQPDLGFLQKDPVYPKYRAALSWQAPDYKMLEDPLLTLDALWYQTSESSRQLEWMGGIEGWFFYRKCAARLGAGSHTLSSGLSYVVTFSRSILQFDYAFSHSLGLSQDSAGSHWFTLTWRWQSK